MNGLLADGRDLGAEPEGGNRTMECQIAGRGDGVLADIEEQVFGTFTQELERPHT